MTSVFFVRFIFERETERENMPIRGYMHVRIQVLIEARGVRCPGVGVTSDCEPPDVGFGKQT